MLKVLLIGDIMGKIGREALKKALPGLKSEFSPDLIIANAENLAHGKGVNPTIIRELLAAGIDFFTSGNHIFNNPKVHDVWADPIMKDKLIRPANFPDGTAGEGWKTLDVGGNKVLVINLICQVFMGDPYGNPFKAIDDILRAHEGEALNAVIVDLHGEATSERVGFGHHVDGRVSSVTGTHTHVPTADARILPKGTAYLTDIGMTGARHSILGVSPEGPLTRFTEAEETLPFEIPEKGPVDLNAVLVTIDPVTRKAVEIKQIQRIIE
jgi:hypothetical protein